MRGLNTDITDSQVRIQALQVLDRVLRHNLRNDMMVIKGRADMIAEVGSEDVVEHAEAIQREADQLLEKAEIQRTISDPLSTESQVKEVNLASVISDVVTALRAEHPAAEITHDLPEQATVTAVDSIDVAIRELVQNVVIHNDQRPPTVRVEVGRADGSTVLRVADDGPGIPKHERQVVTGEQDITPLEHASGLGFWHV